jgi:hypothetical protein
MSKGLGVSVLDAAAGILLSALPRQCRLHHNGYKDVKRWSDDPACAQWLRCSGAGGCCSGSCVVLLVRLSRDCVGDWHMPCKHGVACVSSALLMLLEHAVLCMQLVLLQGSAAAAAAAAAGSCFGVLCCIYRRLSHDVCFPSCC